MKHHLRALGWLPLVFALGACPASGPDPTQPPGMPDAAPAKPSPSSPSSPTSPPSTPTSPIAVVTPDAGETNHADVTPPTTSIDAGAALADPGRPARLFGPKCGGYFGFLQMGLRGQDFPIEDCTAYTHSTAAGSHLYLQFGALPSSVASAYASIVLPMTSWRPGLYSTVAVGRLEVVLKDGRRYRMSIPATNLGGTLAELTVQVDHASSAGDQEPNSYIKGSFAARLEPVAAAGASSDPLFMHIQIDTPAAPGPAPTLQLDCRSQVPGAVEFHTSCALSQKDGTPYVSCRQFGGTGAFGLHVLDLARARAGEVIPLGGASPALRVDGQFASLNGKPPLALGMGTGHFLVHELVPDKVLRGRFINASVTVAAQPGYTCRVAETVFEATPNH